MEAQQLRKLSELDDFLENNKNKLAIVEVLEHDDNFILKLKCTWIDTDTKLEKITTENVKFSKQKQWKIKTLK